MIWTRSKSHYRSVLLIAGCAWFLWLLVHLDAAGIFRLLLRARWYFGLIAAAYAGHELLRAFAYRMCITASGHFSYWELVRFRLVGEAIQFLTSTGPFLAEPAKVWLLQRCGLSVRTALAATVSEYLIYTFTSAAFAIAGLTWLLGHFELPGAVSVAAKVVISLMAIFLLAAAYAIVCRFYLIGLIITALRRLPLIGKHVHFEEQEVRNTEDLLFIVLHDRPLRFLSIVTIEFASQALLVLEVFLFLRAIGTSFSIGEPFLIEAATKFISFAFFFIPGQAGAAEGTYALIFKTLGLSASAGFALAVARRLRSLFVAGIGLALASLWKETRRS